MDFNLQNVEDKIQQCKESIKAFEGEADKERATIKEYEAMINSGESPFPTSSLQNGIESAKTKIVIFEEAIQRERDNIRLLYEQIDHNQTQILLEKEKLARIEIVRETDND